MSQNPKYSDHQESLIALVTHLAMTNWSARTPTNLEKALSINKSEIEVVLSSFKGLFRKSKKKSKRTDDYFYSLQIRHAKQWLNETDDEDEDSRKPPLETEHLTKLLDLVISKAADERRNKIAVVGPWVTAIASLVVAALAIIFKSS
ncbi:hypothetical protein FM037_02960 [Shewanella psychropiezotolerans]|uniref:Uncharacterized protein n=1 Tax=Shewanella psychropiezotolerans TaxID=2593655 RepID=A0ABX5WTK7_9GAMM|nr:hypothetical protein [Shewanella psychropiezotolerans]QDO82391.1 hypothetical protein FM037_02960 [Shewanella psychropiezotolerans]